MRQLAWANASIQAVLARNLGSRNVAEWFYTAIKWGALFGATALFGWIIGVLSLLLDGRPTALAMLPVAMLLGVMLVFKRDLLLITLIVLRAGLDPLLETTAIPLGTASIGAGALLNGLIIVLAIFAVTDGKSENVRKAFLIFCPILFVYFINIFRSPTPVEGVKIFLNIVTWSAAFVIGYVWAQQRGKAYVMTLVAASAVVPILVSVAMLTTGWKFGFTAIRADYVGTEANRFAGPFAHANILAEYTVIVIVALLYLRRQNLGALAKRTNVVILISMLVLLILTRARAAWVGCAVVLFFHALLAERRFLIYMALAGVALMAIPEVRDRLMDLKADRSYLMYARLNSFEWRQLLWKDGLANLHGADWVFGKGLNSFFVESDQFFHMSAGAKWGAHNVYVTLLYDTGVFGVLAFGFLVFGSIMRFAWNCPLDRKASQSGLMLLSMYSVVCITENMLEPINLNIYVWLIVGAMLSAGCTSRLVAHSPQAGA